MTAETCLQFAIATAQQLLQPMSELGGENTTAPGAASEQHKQALRPAGIAHQAQKNPAVLSHTVISGSKAHFQTKGENT